MRLFQERACVEGSWTHPLVRLQEMPQINSAGSAGLATDPRLPMKAFETLHAWLVKLISKMNRQTYSEEQQFKNYAALVRREQRKRARFIRECERGNPCRFPTAPTKSSKKGNTSLGS